jgi:hypothetical protein
MGKIIVLALLEGLTLIFLLLGEGLRLVAFFLRGEFFMLEVWDCWRGMLRLSLRFNLVVIFLFF